MVIGDTAALKSEMINTFINPTSSRKHAYIPKGAHYSRNTVRQQSYRYPDAFLVLTNKTSTVEMKNLLAEVSRARPDAPRLLIGTFQNPAEDEKIHTTVAALFGAVKYLDCNVQGPKSVGTVLGHHQEST
ncbi:hypothetical protein CSAL01_13463 [Colletotrichum salicis]|uniref:Uncharacterized protein n=1 Tax=Colletotrichum salicis TaxID=1209931 RepID=A0A135UVG6_9PEZI|nr:hypothetical protein CSAL01_13463 [Colletotrichum salicis]